MPDFATGELTVEGEYGECLVCGEQFHWTRLTNLLAGSYCDDHTPDVSEDAFWRAVSYYSARLVELDDEGDMGHDTALERDTFGDAL